MDSFEEYFATYGCAESFSVEGSTPIYDRLVAAVGDVRLATYHGQKGGEWNTLASFPLRVRQSVTGAGWMSRAGEPPDVFADLLTARLGENIVGSDPIAWFIREAQRATVERRNARYRNNRRRLGKTAGGTHYTYRNQWCQARGYRSLWHYRRSKGWA